MTTAMVFLMCWATLMVASDTPIGRFLTRFMVDLPAAAANRLIRGNIVLAMIVFMLVILHLHVGDGDPVRMVSLMAPDVAVWLTSFEISALVEASAAFAAAWTAMRRGNVSNIFSVLSHRLGQRSTRNNKRARRGQRPSGMPAANDDEDGAGFALAS